MEYKGAVFREALGGAWGMTDTEQIIPKIAAEQREPGKRADPASGRSPGRSKPRSRTCGRRPPRPRAAFVASPEYTKANDAARLTWDAKYVSKIGSDHTARTPTAGHKVVDPMIRKIRGAYDPTFKGGA